MLIPFLTTLLHEAFSEGRTPGRLKTPPRQKECLECGKTHAHNNSWCSSHCARLWRAKKKYQTKGEN